MSELDDELKQRVWRHIHGELDEKAERELHAQATESEHVARAMQARLDLDALVVEAIKEESLGTNQQPDVVASPPAQDPTNHGRLIPFRQWRRLARVAALFLVALFGATLAFPRGPLRWSPTHITLLSQTRSADAVTRADALDHAAVKAHCSDLRKRMNAAYADAAGDTQRTWRLGLSVTEHTGGAFVVQIDAQATDDKDLTLLETRRYQSVSAFEADIENLSRTMIAALQGNER